MWPTTPNKGSAKGAYRRGREARRHDGVKSSSDLPSPHPSRCPSLILFHALKSLLLAANHGGKASRKGGGRQVSSKVGGGRPRSESGGG